MKTFRCILFGLFAAAVLAPQPAAATPYAFSDAHLLNSAFTTTFGDGYIVSSEPLIGGGVSLTIMLGPYDDGKTQFGDGYPLHSSAGMGWDDVLWHWSSLAAYSGLALNVYYASGPSDTLDMALYMNTGLTGPSGVPTNTVANNTFWSGGWQTLALGQWLTLGLDFDNAQAFEAEDNPEPHTQLPPGAVDGEWLPINMRDRNEISNIGFQIADFTNQIPSFNTPIVIHINVVPEPATLILLCLGLAGIAGSRRKRH